MESIFRFKSLKEFLNGLFKVCDIVAVVQRLPSIYYLIIEKRVAQELEGAEGDVLRFWPIRARRCFWSSL